MRLSDEGARLSEELFEYRRNRYLQLATRELLNERAADLLGLIALLNEAGKIKFESPLEDGGWHILFAHVLEEFKLRGESLDLDCGKRAHLPKPLSDRVMAAIAMEEQVARMPEHSLFRYMEAKWVERALRSGEIRVKAASSFDDSSLNQARKDDELKVSIFLESETARQLKATYQLQVNLENLNRSSKKAKSDYYVLCLCDRFSYRLFDDFHPSDACLVIKNRESFFERSNISFLSRFPRVGCNGLRAYQHEFRITWYPPKPTVPFRLYNQRSGELEFQSSRRIAGAFAKEGVHIFWCRSKGIDIAISWGINECPPATVSSYTVVVSHPRVRDSIFAEHQRPQVAAFMECVDFMQPRWPSRISTFNSIFCRSFRFGTSGSVCQTGIASGIHPNDQTHRECAFQSFSVFRNGLSAIGTEPLAFHNIRPDMSACIRSSASTWTYLGRAGDSIKSLIFRMNLFRVLSDIRSPRWNSAHFQFLPSS